MSEHEKTIRDYAGCRGDGDVVETALDDLLAEQRAEVENLEKALESEREGTRGLLADFGSREGETLRGLVERLAAAGRASGDAYASGRRAGLEEAAQRVDRARSEGLVDLRRLRDDLRALAGQPVADAVVTRMGKEAWNTLAHRKAARAAYEMWHQGERDWDAEPRDMQEVWMCVADEVVTTFYGQPAQVLPVEAIREAARLVQQRSQQRALGMSEAEREWWRGRESGALAVLERLSLPRPEDDTGTPSVDDGALSVDRVRAVLGREAEATEAPPECDNNEASWWSTGFNAANRRAAAALGLSEAEGGEKAPECPGKDCPLCSGEACRTCGPAMWRTSDEHLPPGVGRAPCEHDAVDRHHAEGRCEPGCTAMDGCHCNNCGEDVAPVRSYSTGHYCDRCAPGNVRASEREARGLQDPEEVDCEEPGPCPGCEHARHPSGKCSVTWTTLGSASGCPCEVGPGHL